MTLLLTAATVVAAGAVHRPGWVDLGAGRVVAAGSGAPPRPPDADFGNALIVPGFVDMHVHGGGGASFMSGTAEQAREVIAAHRAHGTTAMVASLVTAAAEPLAAQVTGLAPLVESGELAGIHLEGPWLSPRRPGAHDRAALRPPDVDEVRTLLGAGRGTIRMVTLAPELPGAVAAIRLLTDAGVVAAVGHTDATYAQTRTAIAAGARVGTHLFNAMRPIEHREPGPVTALAEDPAVTVELILDGVHLHPAVYGLVSRWVGEGRIALVTDATAAAGMPDGDYTLGSLRVTVTRGVATVSGTQTLAGGTATMDRLFREAVRLRSDVPDGVPHDGVPDDGVHHDGVQDDGVPHDGVPHDGVSDDALLHAVRETSLVPARALGLGARDLSPGSPADLVVLAPDLTPERVIVSGVVVGP